MANVFDNQGDLDQALEHYRMVLPIQLKALGPEHPDVGMTYNLSLIHI